MNDPLHADDVHPDAGPPRLPEWLERKLEARRPMRAASAPSTDATTAEAATAVDDAIATRPTTNERDAFTRTTAEASRGPAFGEGTMDMSTLTFPASKFEKPASIGTEPRVAIGFRRMLVGADGPIVFHTPNGPDVLPKGALVRGGVHAHAIRRPLPGKCGAVQATPREHTAPRAPCISPRMPPALNLPPPRMPPAASNIPPPPPLVSNVGRATQPPRRVGLHLLPWVIAVATFGFVGALGYLDERGLETDLRGAVRAFTTSLVVRARP